MTTSVLSVLLIGWSKFLTNPTHHPDPRAVVSRHQNGSSALVSQMSFHGKTNGVAVKCRPFSQANSTHVLFFSESISWVTDVKTSFIILTICCIFSSDPVVFVNYIMWTVIHKFIMVMPQAYQDAYNDYATVVIGNKTRHRWKECIDKMQSVFGMPLGLLFVDAAFDEQSKKTVTMV